MLVLFPIHCVIKSLEQPRKESLLPFLYMSIGKFREIKCYRLITDRPEADLNLGLILNPMVLLDSILLVGE